MTRIAILADIHGNLPALEAVLNDLKQVSPDRVIVNGDVINRGPQSVECLEAVRAEGWPVVFGNHEEYVLKYVDRDHPPEWLADFYYPTRHLAYDQLTPEDVAYLRTRPWFVVVDAPGLLAIRVMHGSPLALNDGIGFWLSDAQLLARVNDVPEPVVVASHTHRTLDRRVGERWFLNTGAVGAPFNGNPDAQYLVLTGTNAHWEADFRSVPYDHAPVYDAWEQTGYLDRSMLSQVFKYEVETATFHLASYLQFCRAHGISINAMASFQRYRDASQDVTPGRSLKV